MFDYLIIVWFFVILIPLSVLCYHALMAVDFSRIFRQSSTWQIKLLALVISIGLASLVAISFVVICLLIRNAVI